MRNVKSEREHVSRVQLFETPWAVTHQVPLSMGLYEQEHWSRSSLPSPGDLPDPGIAPQSPALQVDSLLSEAPGKPYEKCIPVLFCMLTPCSDVPYCSESWIT